MLCFAFRIPLLSNNNNDDIDNNDDDIDNNDDDIDDNDDDIDNNNNDDIDNFILSNIRWMPKTTLLILISSAAISILEWVEFIY